MDRAHLQLRRFIRCFEHGVERLFEVYEGELSKKVPRERLEAYVTSCRHQITGNLVWGLQTSRYGLADCRQGPDSFVFEL